jgi:asparagine synthase (glutamine-hydrolysing)
VFRFVALVCESNEPAQLAAMHRLSAPLRGLPPWTCDIDQGRIQVFHAGAESSSSDAFRLYDGCGVVLGTLFERDADVDLASLQGKTTLSQSDCTRILSSRGRDLISRYWGRYVAILCDPISDIVSVLRDPSGHMPCFRTRCSGIRVYFSYLGDCVQLGMRFSINWDYLTTRMVLFGLQCTETGLSEVAELQPGECDTIAVDTISSRFYWHPFSIANEPCVEEVDEAARQLRTTVKACVNRWAACYSDVLHRLSGGLDSSIVIGCLRDAPRRPQVTCVTYYPDAAQSGQDMDERVYARAAARQANCKLVEIPRSPTSRLEMMLGLGSFPIPMIFNGRNVEESALERQLARQHGANARFGGEGGDQIFFQSPISATVGDYIWHRGLTRSVFRIAWDVAEREQLSVWRVLKEALLDRIMRSRWDPNEHSLRAPEFVSSAALEAVTRNDSLRKRFMHPWFRSSAALPHGKLWQILWLSLSPRLYAPLDQDGDPERVEPLASQPLLELCLRIPTYILASGAEDRSLARRAFSHDVPANILARRTKGSIEAFIRQTILGNLEFVRTMLLEGVLVRENLLDRRRLELALSGRPERIAGTPACLFDFLGIEAWARRWDLPDPPGGCPAGMPVVRVRPAVV